MLLFISAPNLELFEVISWNVKQIEIAPGCQAKFEATYSSTMRTE